MQWEPITYDQASKTINQSTGLETADSCLYTPTMLPEFYGKMSELNTVWVITAYQGQPGIQFKLITHKLLMTYRAYSNSYTQQI